MLPLVKFHIVWLCPGTFHETFNLVDEFIQQGSPASWDKIWPKWTNCSWRWLWFGSWQNTVTVDFQLNRVPFILILNGFSCVTGFRQAPSCHIQQTKARIGSLPSNITPDWTESTSFKHTRPTTVSKDASVKGRECPSPRTWNHKGWGRKQVTSWIFQGEVPFTWEHQDLIQWFKRNNKPPEHGGCECRVASQLSFMCHLNVKNHPPPKKGVKLQKKSWICQVLGRMRTI